MRQPVTLGAFKNNLPKCTIKEDMKFVLPSKKNCPITLRPRPHEDDCKRKR